MPPRRRPTPNPVNRNNTKVSMKYKTYLAAFVCSMVAMILFQNLSLVHQMNGDDSKKTPNYNQVRLRHSKPNSSLGDNKTSGTLSKKPDIAQEKPEASENAETEKPEDQPIATVKPETPSPTPAPVAEAPKPVETTQEDKAKSNTSSESLQENKTAESDLDSVVVVPPPTPTSEKDDTSTGTDEALNISLPTPPNETEDVLEQVNVTDSNTNHSDINVTDPLANIVPLNQSERVKDDSTTNGPNVTEEEGGPTPLNTSDFSGENNMALNVTRLTLADVEDWEKSSSVGLVVATSPEMEAHLIHNSQQPVTSSIAWPNVTTLSYKYGRFYSGYRNQIMAFTMMVFKTMYQEHGQLLMDSLRQKDTYGSNRFIPFRDLWDVAHWNSHYPRLPRLVDFDPIIHEQYSPQNYPPRYQMEDKNFTNANGTFITPHSVRPYVDGDQKLMYGYKGYAKGRGTYAVDGHRNPAEILMMQGAMRPHPDMQAIIDDKLKQLVPNQTPNPDGSFDYMTLHARVEPDMQAHPMCREKKVLNLTTIFDFIQTKWPTAPVSTIFMPINRQYMELEGVVKANASETNWIAVENLRALNWARDEGLWNGTAKVVEFGANALEGTRYADTPSTPGAMMNFFIGVNAKIFIGTEVSSYSHDLLATRFFRNLSQNYYYLPDGLHDWSPPGTVDPAGFRC